MPSVPHFDILFSYEKGKLSEINSLKENRWVEITLAELAEFADQDERINHILEQLNTTFPST